MDVEGWIERALHRVEMLEAERARCAASGDPQAALRTIEIDAEIEALVEALEAAADAAEAEAGVASPAVPGMADHAWAPVLGVTTLAEPLPPSDDTAPMRVASDPSATALDEPIELPRRRYPWPAAVAAIAVLVLGVGAAVASSGTLEVTATSKPAASVSAAVPTTVAAAEIPDDTQEPQTARGADVDVTPPTVIPEAVTTDAPQGAAEASRTSKTPRRKKARRARKKPRKKASRGVAFDRSRDPLAGLK